jgi:hypothetical protein
MDASESAMEHIHEEIHEQAHHATEGWILGVALSAAILAVFAAVTALQAEHSANEALLAQIQAQDRWNYYQATKLKASLLETRLELFKAMGKPVSPADEAKLKKYGPKEEELKKEAEELDGESKKLSARHGTLSLAVTLFQVGIAIGAVSVLTKRKRFWYIALAFGAIGLVFLVLGLLPAGASAESKEHGGQDQASVRHAVSQEM